MDATSGSKSSGETRLRTRSPERLRVFIGDVQGCADELDDLLAALPFDAERHRLVFVGDLVNRGPSSARVLRRAIELGAETVLGNHDLHLLARVEGERRSGRRDTLDDVLEAPDRKDLLDWLRARPLVLEWEDLICVHAGLHPGWGDGLRAIASPLEAAIRSGRIPWDHEDLGFFTFVRHCDAEGRRPEDDETPPAGYFPWDHHYDGERTVVCGHWAKRGLVVRSRLRALDTGCVWGGRLTAWVAEEDRIVSVPARRQHQVLEPR